MKFQQRDIDRDIWETLNPGQTVDYAWEEPNMAHKLCCLLESEGVRDNSEHEYNLDVIKVCFNTYSHNTPRILNK